MKRLRAFCARCWRWCSRLWQRPPWQDVTPDADLGRTSKKGRFVVRQLRSGRELIGYRGDSGATALRIFQEYKAFRPGTIECLQLDPDGTVHRRGYRAPR